MIEINGKVQSGFLRPLKFFLTWRLIDQRKRHPMVHLKSCPRTGCLSCLLTFIKGLHAGLLGLLQSFSGDILKESFFLAQVLNIQIHSKHNHVSYIVKPLHLKFEKVYLLLPPNMWVHFEHPNAYVHMLECLIWWWPHSLSSHLIPQSRISVFDFRFDVIEHSLNFKTTQERVKENK